MKTIGLTGGLGSGKSTAAMMFAELGAHILNADEIARELMQPGTAVYDAIVRKFGETVVEDDGTLNRPLLARLAFTGDLVEELNRIVHPATIARQEELAREIFANDPRAIVIVESALIFETRHSRGWRSRFDNIILVRATEEEKIARYIRRCEGAEDAAKLEAEARRRLARQIADDKKVHLCDFVILNDGTLDRLRDQVSKIWTRISPASV